MWLKWFDRLRITACQTVLLWVSHPIMLAVQYSMPHVKTSQPIVNGYQKCKWIVWKANVLLNDESQYEFYICILNINMTIIQFIVQLKVFFTLFKLYYLHHYPENRFIRNQKSQLYDQWNFVANSTHRAKPSPDPMLAHCSLYTGPSGTKSINLNKNTTISFHENQLENVVCKVAVTSSRHPNTAKCWWNIGWHSFWLYFMATIIKTAKCLKHILLTGVIVLYIKCN